MKKKENVKPLSLSIHHEKSKKIQQLFVEDIVLPYGSEEKLNFKVTNNEKIHLVGENGSGKSTLFKIILGELKPRSGRINLNAKIFYCDQHFSLLEHQLTMLECMEKYCTDLNEVALRTILAGIGFRGDKVYTQAAQLSGGEKMRLMILIASHQVELPLLLLDEPDNHLDIESKSVLANALNEFNGSLILISHDEYLVNHINKI
ncbi:MAG: ATP-binding cassette domain-containing protein [Colwellia sp.]